MALSATNEAPSPPSLNLAWRKWSGALEGPGPKNLQERLSEKSWLVCVRSVDNLMTLYAQVEQHRKLQTLHQAGIKDLQTRRGTLLPTRPQRLKRTTHTDSYLQRIQSVQNHCWPNWPLRKPATAMHSPCLSPPKGQEQHLPQPEQGPRGINIQEPLVKYLLLQQSNLKTIGLVEIIVPQIETTPHVCRTHAR